MSVIARLASSDSTLIVQKDDELFRWDMTDEPEGAITPITTPYGADDWIDSTRLKYGLSRVVDKDDVPDPEIDTPEFPKLKAKVLDDGEQVYQITTGD